MEVILKKDIEKLGYKDDVVKVKDGYGRNYLIPQGLAIVATGSAKKVLSENLKQRAHKEAKVRQEAEKLGKALATVSVKVGAKAGENGKIFGSVNTIQVSDALKKLGYDVDRKHISIKNEPIKVLGKYEAVIRLHKDLTETITFEVVEE
ncbi:MAG: 50S ribosomal protein L9 [Flavobacteriales bacterium]|nr:50S ribosomal protein L9 [Flavobacteriales bacterium]HRJ38424.1 50S ribosomal protein L9 [Flavobacteriales bacterium]